MENQGEKTSAKQTFNKILSKSFLKPFSCVGILFIFSEWSGYNAYLNYMIEVLETSGFDLDPRIGPIIVGSIRLFFAGKCTSVLDILFCQSTTFIKVCLAFDFGLQTL